MLTPLLLYAQVDCSWMPRRSRASVQVVADVSEEPARHDRPTKRTKCKAPALPVQVMEQQNDLFAAIFDSIYSPASTALHPNRISFCINAKKLEEAKGVFAEAIASGKRRCIVVKGPTGAGKSWMIEAVLKAHSGQVSWARLEETLDASEVFEADPLPAVFNPTQTTRSLFPALSFACPAEPAASSGNVLDRLPVTWCTDAIIQTNGWSSIRKCLDRFRTLPGLLVFEATEAEDDNGSRSNLAAASKLLLEMYSDMRTISLNALTAPMMKRMLQPLAAQFAERGIVLDGMVERFNGDVRAFLHDLLFVSVAGELKKQASREIFFRRDYRTDFFHYVGKLLYPCKDPTNPIHKDNVFWDLLDLNTMLVFLQYHLPSFYRHLDSISAAFDSFSSFDAISWKASSHVSMQAVISASSYTPILATFLCINQQKQGVPADKGRSFYSFSRPPILPRAQRAAEDPLRDWIREQRLIYTTPVLSFCSLNFRSSSLESRGRFSSVIRQSPEPQTRPPRQKDLHSLNN